MSAVCESLGLLVNSFLCCNWTGGGVGGAERRLLGSWSASDCLRASVWIRHHGHCLWCLSWVEVCLHAPEIDGQLRAAMHTEDGTGHAGRGSTHPHHNLAQWETGYCLEPEPNIRGPKPPQTSKRLINSSVCYCCLRGSVAALQLGGVGVIGALGSAWASCLPGSTLMNRRLRPEPTQLLHGIVGRHEAITEIPTSDECFDPKRSAASSTKFRFLLQDGMESLAKQPSSVISDRKKKQETITTG